MKIFPKGITEQIYNQHLLVYSKTLIAYISEIQKNVPIEHYVQLPYNIYLCPLCLKNYFIKTDVGVIGNSEFSLDHLPPQSAGGKYKIITCKKCNNDSGAFESELEKILNFGIDKTGLNEGPFFKLSVKDIETGKSIQGSVRNDNGIADINFDENKKKYNKGYIDFLKKLHSNKMPKLELGVQLYDSKKLERALIKSAYLLCFFWWGYEFVFSENGALIREVIAGKKDYPCQVPLKWLEKDEIQPTGISILQDGNKRLAFLVNINLKGLEVNTTACILIPSPTKDGIANISLLSEINKLSPKKALSYITLPRIVHSIGYTISWNIVIPKPV
jgi:hypothetical protein